MNPNPLYAVFTREPRERLTSWTSWQDAQIAYYGGDRKVERVVRSSADPAWCGAPKHQPPVVEPAKFVKLSRDERERLLNLGRQAGHLEGAKDRMLDALCTDPRFEHLEAEELSDYAWAAAKFCYPREWAQEWS